MGVGGGGLGGRRSLFYSDPPPFYYSSNFSNHRLAVHIEVVLIKKRRVIKLKVDKFLSNYLFWAMNSATKSFRL